MMRFDADGRLHGRPVLFIWLWFLVATLAIDAAAIVLAFELCGVPL